MLNKKFFRRIEKENLQELQGFYYLNIYRNCNNKIKIKGPFFSNKRCSENKEYIKIFYNNWIFSETLELKTKDLKKNKQQLLLF